MSIHELLQERREDILRIAAQHGASHVRIFGSVARGEERQDSDVDFLVDMQETSSLFDLIGLQQDIEKVLGQRVDVLTPDGINRYLRDRILGEAAPL